MKGFIQPWLYPTVPFWDKATLSFCFDIARSWPGLEKKPCASTENAMSNNANRECDAREKRYVHLATRWSRIMLLLYEFFSSRMSSIVFFRRINTEEWLLQSIVHVLSQKLIFVVRRIIYKVLCELRCLKEMKICCVTMVNCNFLKTLQPELFLSNENILIRKTYYTWKKRA